MCVIYREEYYYNIETKQLSMEKPLPIAKMKKFRSEKITEGYLAPRGQ